MDFNKKWKKLLFAVQIEKTEINILQKKDKGEKLFLNLINPQQCIDKVLSSLIKNSPPVVTCDVNCGVISVNERDVRLT